LFPSPGSCEWSAVVAAPQLALQRSLKYASEQGRASIKSLGCGEKCPQFALGIAKLIGDTVFDAGFGG